MGSMGISRRYGPAVTLETDSYDGSSLTDRTGITAHDSAYTTLNLLRGNRTTTIQPGSTRRVSYDIGGMSVSADDGRGHNIAAVRDVWATNLSKFFDDLAAFGIMNITPTPATGEPWAGTLPPDPMCAAYQEEGCPAPRTAQCYVEGTGKPGKLLNFFKWLPYGLDPSDSNNPDGRLDHDNQAYYCSPTNPIFWGWDKFHGLVDKIACAAQGAACSPQPIRQGTRLNIEEFDLQNEVSLYNFTVQARLIYDNTHSTPVFENLGGALADHTYLSTALTVSVITDSPANPSNTCSSVYSVKDPLHPETSRAQVVHASELLAATTGDPIGAPSFVAYDGGMACDNSAAHAECQSDPQGLWHCATSVMIPIPTQTTPTVTDMHAKPCVWSGTPGSCAPTIDATDAATRTFSAVWDFISGHSGLININNAVIFGETWSNTPFYYTDKPCDGRYATHDLAQQTVLGYRASTLYSSGPSIGNPGAYASNVVFRPWESAAVDWQTCETPATIGAPSGPYKR